MPEKRTLECARHDQAQGKSGRAIAQGRQKRSLARRAARRQGARGPHGPRRPSVQPLRGRTNAPSAPAGRGDQEAQSHVNPGHTTA